MSNQTRWLFSFALIVALMGAAVFLWPAPDRVEESVSEEGMLASDGSKSALAAPSEASGESKRREDADSGDSSGPLGRRMLQVVNEDGSPAMGIEVYYKIESGEELPEWLMSAIEQPSAQLADSATQRGDGSVVSNEQGLIALPEEGFGYAGAITEAGEGAVAFGFFHPDQSAPLVLQLRTSGRVSVLVIDAQGAPVAGIPVEIESATEAELEAERLAEAGNDGVPTRSWRRVNGLRRVTNELGRTWISTEVDASFLPPRQWSEANRRFRIAAELPLGVPLSKQFALGVDHEVQLQLRPSGGMRVRFLGYPEGLVPSLRVIAKPGEESGHWPYPALPHPNVDPDGAWRFEPIPIGQRYAVTAVQGYFDPTGQMLGGGSGLFDPENFDGPAAAGEVVEVEMQLNFENTLRGRLLQPDGSAFQRQEDGRMSFSLIGLHSAFPDRWIRFDIDLGEDGRFLAKPQSQPNTRGWYPKVHELDRVYFAEVHRSRAAWMLEGDEVLSHGSWASVPIALPQSADGHDLGDITMGQVDPILQIKVVDTSGKPIHAAEFRFGAFLHYREPGRDGSWTGVNLRESAITEEDGLFVLGGPSLDVALGSGYVDLLAQRYRVQVTHRDYLAATVEFERDQNLVEVELAQAAAIQGEVRFPTFMHSVWIHAVPAGGSPQDRTAARTVVYSPGPNNNSDDGFTVGQFELTPLPAGSYDLVFQLPGGTERELLRVPGVIAAPKGEESLDRVDLEPWVNAVAIEIYMPNGELLVPEFVGDLIHTFGVQVPGQNWLERIYPTFDEGAFHISVPVGESAQASFRLKEYRTIDLSGLLPGRHSVQLEPKPVLQVSYSGRDQIPAGWALRISLDPLNSNASPVLVPAKGADFAFKVDQAGAYKLAWIARNVERGLLASFEQEINLEEATLQANRPLVLPIPEELFERMQKLDSREGG